MNALEQLRAKKRSGDELTPLQELAWEAAYIHGDAKPAEELDAQTRDAQFMAHVWQMLRKNGWLDEVELTDAGGDLEGVDFVAQRILGMQS